MPQTTITVAGITPPAQGKKQGKIADTAGNNWNVWGDKLQNYRMGVTYNITYEENEFNNVRYNVIKNAEPAGQGTQQTTMPLAQPRVAMPPPSVATPKDEMIFVCGALNHTLANQNISPLELTAMEIGDFVNKLRTVWKGTLGSQKSRSEGEMDDAIPF